MRRNVRKPESLPPPAPPRLRALGDSPGFGERVAYLMAASPDPGTAADVFLDEVEGMLGCAAWLAVREPHSTGVSWLPAHRTGPLALPGEAAAPGLLEEVIREGRDLILRSPSKVLNPVDHEVIDRDGGVWALLPVHGGVSPVACLVLHTSASGQNLEGGLADLKSALPVAALAVNAHILQRDLEGRIEEVTREVSILYDVSRSLGLVNTAEGLFELLGTSLSRTVGYDLCAFLLESAGRVQASLQLAASVETAAIEGFQRLALQELSRLMTAPMTGTFAIAGPEDLGIEAASAPVRAIHAVVHAPLFVRGQAVGLLSLGSRNPDLFTEQKRRLLYTIANQASLTIDRLRRTREAEATRIHSMLDSMAEGVLLLDQEQHVVMSNPAAQEQLEILDPDYRTGRLSRLGEVSLAPVLASLSGVAPSSKTFEVSARLAGRLFSVTCSPVQEHSHEAQGFVIVVSDITEARMRQIQMAQNEKLSALGEMISGVAHELNNPLATVIGHAQLLQGKGVDEETRRNLGTIDAEATRCRRIVQNLLQFARTQNPERRPLDVNGILDAVIQLLGHQLRVNDIHLVTEMDQRLRPVVGDGHLLQQVFVNIIFNAYQAMRERGGPGTLRVRSAQDVGRVIVEIADSGPGIPQDHLKRIFDPFFTTKEVGKGTGLGLSLAYGTVRGHGGTITASSAPEGGALFRVELPAAPPGVTIDARMDAAGVKSPPDLAAGHFTSTASLAGKRVLVLEDEGPLAEVIAEVLATMGLEVETVPDGRSAIERLKTGHFDAILSDMKMPNMNGRDFYRHVASVNPALARRIIFSTGDTANAETLAFFEEVGNPFISKPFNIKDLIRVVGVALATI